MFKIKKILAPTDLSELSEAGVRYALEIARWLGAEVIVYHVIHPQEIDAYYNAFHRFSSTEEFDPARRLTEERYQAIAEFLTENFAAMISEIKIHQSVEVGLPHRSIVEKAKKEGADMIVMSTHGRTGVVHMLLGSVTEKVTRRAPCPVLSVRPPKEAKLAQAATA